MDDGRTDQMDDIGILRARDPDKEIVGLDVAVYERLVMDGLNSGNLICKQKTQNKRQRRQAPKASTVRKRDSPFASQPCTLF